MIHGLSYHFQFSFLIFSSSDSFPLFRHVEYPLLSDCKIQSIYVLMQHNPIPLNCLNKSELITVAFITTSKVKNYGTSFRFSQVHRHIPEAE